MTKFNKMMFLGTGFFYSLVGTENTGYKVSILGRHSEYFRTLEEAESRIMRSFRWYMSK